MDPVLWQVHWMSNRNDVAWFHRPQILQSVHRKCVSEYTSKRIKSISWTIWARGSMCAVRGEPSSLFVFCFRSHAHARLHQQIDGISTAFPRWPTVISLHRSRLDGTKPYCLTRLYFKRALPNECSNKIEHLLTSENVLIRFKTDLEQPVIESDFNEENVRNYFQGYGSIVNLLPLKTNCFVIEFNDYGELTRLSNALCFLNDISPSVVCPHFVAPV